MEWKEVESSQIAEVGYDHDAEVLGIRFKPTKKQKEAAQPGSEYHYKNVKPEMHQSLLNAESVGKYFGEVIKPYPTLYPFFKVEPTIEEEFL